MQKAEKLKYTRDLLLKLHKVLLDHEREIYEGIHGPLNATQFLNVLLEDEDFAWLRKFSMLIVEIDEMFAQKDGIDPAMINANLQKIRELIEMRDPDEYFRAKYQHGIQQNIDAAALQSEIRGILTNNL